MASLQRAVRDATSSTPLGVTLLGTLVLLFPVTHVASAQERETASLGGVIVEAGTGRPLRGASVLLIGNGGRGVTDAEGRFILYDLPPGRHRVRITYRGHDARDRAIDLAPSRHTDVRIALAVSAELEPLPEDVVPLPPLGIRIDRPERHGKLRPFRRRLAAGRGSFITRAQIVERDPDRLSDLLREVAGIRVSRSSTFGAEVRTVRGCGLRLFIDGLPAPGFTVDDMPPHDVAGVEIYAGLSETPIRFRRTGDCGALVIWTRDPADP